MNSVEARSKVDRLSDLMNSRDNLLSEIENISKWNENFPFFSHVEKDDALSIRQNEVLNIEKSIHSIASELLSLVSLDSVSRIEWILG